MQSNGFNGVKNRAIFVPFFLGAFLTQPYVIIKLFNIDPGSKMDLIEHKDVFCHCSCYIVIGEADQFLLRCVVNFSREQRREIIWITKDFLSKGGETSQGKM